MLAESSFVLTNTIQRLLNDDDASKVLSENS